MITAIAGKSMNLALLIKDMGISFHPDNAGQKELFPKAQNSGSAPIEWIDRSAPRRCCSSLRRTGATRLDSQYSR